ncbi:hypothetical protein [Stenotrophomonas sp. ZAC14A_NAIMI4_1]|uniref:hypothetical protein n=1 Tax=Stenotrophomonas sp. ZAC14A_NAIMI4_1 TaxID=2072412 RepID=UPI000D53ECAC|nr:hypothetical protein [Stenotrophomonas sp. ZAC14A_NAIMI4_1]AWH44693.1 hypothetical protein C1926_06485 [Stenotrophomonas sp. ZAC14A_NAIMI4_1]
MLKVHSVEFDKVVKSAFISAQADYDFALNELVPLVGKLDIQREVQNPKFYDRLARDIVAGCIMPPLTLAIVIDDDNFPEDSTAASEFLEKNIKNFFVLDGMQRLSTLDRAKKRHPDDFPLLRPIFLNALICNSMDLLLYRMITLNNGQKPMTARHQIEIIASNIYDFESAGVNLQAEKRVGGQKRKRGVFKKADMIKAYLAFLSESVNVDNDKIIQEKMDDLLASKIMNSGLTSSETNFEDVLVQIERLYEIPECREWIMAQNNLIGFCAGARSSVSALKNLDEVAMQKSITEFELAFAGINVSKIKLGNARRRAVKYFIDNIKRLSKRDSDEILDEISQEV